MASLKYVKGVRTRYRNTLEKEIAICMEMIQQDVSEVDKHTELLCVKKKIQMLNTYCEKLEGQTEKYVSGLDESQSDEIETILDEDFNLCEKARDCCCELEAFRDLLVNVTKVKVVKEEQESQDQPDELQKRMLTFMNDQSERQQQFVEQQTKQQQEFIERQVGNQQKVLDKLFEQKDNSSSVKLPKLELKTFDGDKLKWAEFWDSFECTVHNNTKLSDIEKFNYLKSKLVGEAKNAISGLSLCNENYKVAVSLLIERYGRKQELIDLHYHKMMCAAPPSNRTEHLRQFLDTVEKHLRSLEVMGENTDQNMFVSMIKSKLPKDTLLHLEVQKGTSKDWSVRELRERLRAYITARERSEQDGARREPAHVQGTRQIQSKGIDYENRALRQTGKPESAFVRQRTSSESLVSGDRLSGSYANKCRYCVNRHWSDECTRYKTIAERKRLLKDSCYKCLKVGHRTDQCKQSKTCVHCGERDVHHRSLCPKKFSVKTSVPNRKTESTNMTEEVSDPEINTEGPENVLVTSAEIVLMQTARTEAKNPSHANSSQLRLLLDSGSQRTYVTERLAEQLGLEKGESQEIKLVTFGSKKAKVIKTPSTKLEIKLNNGKYMKMTANIVPEITGTIERKAVNVTQSDELQHIFNSVDMADTIPTDSEYSSVDLLIGNDYYLDLVLPQRIEIRPGLYLLSSKLGWILTGRTNESDTEVSESNMLILTYGSDLTRSTTFASVDSVVPQKPNLEDFWSIEAIGVTDDPKDKEDDRVMDKFKETLRFEDGRYQATWPWKEETPDLPTNFGLAMGRLKSTVGRLKDTPEFMQQYNSVIEDQLKRGVIEKVSGDIIDGVKHYLPHHAVVTPHKTTTKLRLVYDASAKTTKSNKSLNKCLYRGPVMLHDLCGILMRFRTYNVAVVADIEKAFLQVGLQPDQRDATRFLWLKDCNDPTTARENIQEYRFCRIPFGVISSPFILGATIECHLDSCKSDLAETLKQDIYVDNVITGTNTEGEALSMYMNSKKIFNDAAMNLREWSTNSKLVKSMIPEKDRAVSMTTKVLGHVWDSDQDTLSIKEPAILAEDQEPTKRFVLKQLASLYDPLGLFSPVVLRGKVLLQTLWSKHLLWDDHLDPEDVTFWNVVKEELRKIPQVAIPRCIALQEAEKVTFTLHCFCDASTSAYATAIYLHQTSGDVSKTDLLFAKSRLAPTKTITIPRPELLAVLIGVRCVKFVKDNLRLPVEQVYVWSDSQCVLHWIAAENVSSVFVANRVKEIKNSCVTEFLYIRSAENPADIASRGATVSQLRENQLWWHGPQWLQHPVDNWKAESGCRLESETRKVHGHLSDAPENSEEMAEAAVEIESETSTESSPFGIDSERYSSASKLIRVTAFALRFLNKVRKKTDISGPLTKQELEDAEGMWIKHVQSKWYSEVFDSLAKGKPNNLQTQLGLYVDESGLLRCKGRLENADLSEAARQPILLPHNEHFTQLVIDRVHRDQLHSGVSQTLSGLRYRFWIPKGRASIRKVIQKCLVCRRHEGGAYKMPEMAPLPRSRVTQSTPFSCVGLDYLGPLYVKGKDGAEKIWICLFTCLVTRAIHLELMHSLSTEEFLMGLRRFIACRGKPDEIWSDNAPQFKLASEAMNLVWRNTLKCCDVQNYASDKGIHWTFIVELAPWMGGFYERLVGLVKRSLRKAIGRKLLTDVQLQTIMKEVESVVNSRPLVYVGDDVNSMVPLSPSNFLSLNPRLGIPETENTDDDTYQPYESSAEKLLKTWKKGQKILNSFWRSWKDEYLLSLRERTQTKLRSSRIQSQFNPSVGDVVLVKDNIPRGCWRLGLITELVQSSDGHIRSAKVRLASGRVIGRPLNSLYPLEVSGDIDQGRSPSRPDNMTQRPKSEREAAKKANEMLKKYFNDN